MIQEARATVLSQGTSTRCTCTESLHLILGQRLQRSQ